MFSSIGIQANPTNATNLASHPAVAALFVDVMVALFKGDKPPLVGDLVGSFIKQANQGLNQFVSSSTGNTSQPTTNTSVSPNIAVILYAALQMHSMDPSKLYAAIPDPNLRGSASQIHMQAMQHLWPEVSKHQGGTASLTDFAKELSAPTV